MRSTSLCSSALPRLLTACLLALPTSLLAAQPAPTELQTARESIVRHVQEKAIPGLSVAVWKDGRILWEEGFGWADRAARVPVTEHTMFCLASLSKPLTATALMTLVRDGKVDLDKPVNDYLGDDRLTSHIGNPKDVTVRRVANHTSGLPGSDQWFYGADVANTPDFSETIRRYGILVTPAGERWRYSNLGYGVLGHVMSRVSGKSYGEFMQQSLFVPLGMNRSALDITPGFDAYKATRYDYAGRPIPFYLSAEPPSATLFASAHDLARFGMFMLKEHAPDQRAVLSDELIDSMTKNPARESDDSEYGIGWEVSKRGGHRVVSHSGSTSGVSTNFMLVPEQRLGVVMLANTDGGVPTDIQLDILKTLLPSWQEEPAPAARPKATFQPTRDLIGRWEGKIHTYEGDVPMQLKILASGDVHVQIGGESRWQSRSNTRMTTLLNATRFENNELTGRAMSQIETSDTARHPHTVSLSLVKRGQVLNGTSTAVSIYDGLWIYGLPYWTELRKIAAE